MVLLTVNMEPFRDQPMASLGKLLRFLTYHEFEIQSKRDVADFQICPGRLFLVSDIITKSTKAGRNKGSAYLSMNSDG